MSPHIHDLDPYPVSIVSTGGSDFTYRSVGEPGNGKPTILLLHGIGSGSGSWGHQFDDFKQSAYIVAWDAPGYGGSTPLDKPNPAAADYARALRVFCDALGLAEFVIVGHSLGAIQAARFTVEYPEMVARLILAAPARGYGDAGKDKRDTLIAERIGKMDRLGPDGLAASRAPLLLGSKATPDMVELVAENMRRLNPSGYAQAVHLLAHARITDDLAHITGPVLFIGAGDDTITPPDGVRDLAQATPNGTYVEIPGAGHVCYIDHPADFNSTIRTDIANRTRGAK